MGEVGIGVQVKGEDDENDVIKDECFCKLDEVLGDVSKQVKKVVDKVGKLPGVDIARITFILREVSSLKTLMKNLPQSTFQQPMDKEEGKETHILEWLQCPETRLLALPRIDHGFQSCKGLIQDYLEELEAHRHTLRTYNEGIVRCLAAAMKQL